MQSLEVKLSHRKQNILEQLIFLGIQQTLISRDGEGGAARKIGRGRRRGLGRWAALAAKAVQWRKEKERRPRKS